MAQGTLDMECSSKVFSSCLPTIFHVPTGLKKKGKKKWSFQVIPSEWHVEVIVLLLKLKLIAMNIEFDALRTESKLCSLFTLAKPFTMKKFCLSKSLEFF